MIFRAVLVANRGEIALRLIRACRALGIRTVAVYSKADAGALHARAADEAHLIGPAPARESCLAAERILEVARAARADAVHPGYGFLSASWRFAETCEACRIEGVRTTLPLHRRIMGAAGFRAGHVSTRFLERGF